MNPKMQWLRNKISSMNLQGMIVSNPVNIRYLTNLEAEGTLIMKTITNRFDVETFCVFLLLVLYIVGFIKFLYKLFSK